MAAGVVEQTWDRLRALATVRCVRKRLRERFPRERGAATARGDLRHALEGTQPRIEPLDGTAALHEGTQRRLEIGHDTGAAAEHELRHHAPGRDRDAAAARDRCDLRDVAFAQRDLDAHLIAADRIVNERRGVGRGERRAVARPPVVLEDGLAVERLEVGLQLGHFAEVSGPAGISTPLASMRTPFTSTSGRPLALPPRRRTTISERIESAISCGVSAPMSRSLGGQTRRKSSGAKPSSCSRSSKSALRLRLATRPTYAGSRRSTATRAS